MTFSFGKPKVKEIKDPLSTHLDKLKDSFDQKTPDFRFYQLFYKIKEKPPTKPPHPCLSEAEWATALENADENKSPELLIEFKALETRITNHQESAIKKMEDKLIDMATKIKELKQTANDLQNVYFKKIYRNSLFISLLLLDKLKTNEVQSLKNLPFSTQEHDYLEHLIQIQEEMQKPNHYEAKLNELHHQADLIEENVSKQPEVVISNELKEQAIKILKEHNTGLSGLTKEIKKMEKMVKSMESALMLSSFNLSGL